MGLYLQLCKITWQTREDLATDPELITYNLNKIGDKENRILAHYATLGRYDMVLVTEAINDTKAAQLSLALSSVTGMDIETLPTIITNNLTETTTSEDPTLTTNAYFDVPTSDYPKTSLQTAKDILNSLPSNYNGPDYLGDALRFY